MARSGSAAHESTGAAAPPGDAATPGPPVPAATGRERGASRARRITVQVLVWLTTLLAVVGIFAVWANREVLNPNNWSDTSTKLLQNAAIRQTTADYLVEQLYKSGEVEQRLRAQLPSQIKPLSGPLAGGLRALATEATKRLLESPRVQELWRQANRAADQTLVKIAEGGSGSVNVNGGAVTLDLAAVVDEIATRLGLPEVGSKLPPSVAHLRILRSDQISAVQEGANALKGLALVLTILVPLLYALAIALAAGFRRRTLMTVGIALVIAGVVVLVGRSIIISQVSDSLVKTESVRPAARAVLSIATLRLSEVAGAFIVVGVPLIAAAWFAGPARAAVRGRRAIAPFLREHPGWAYAITAGVMALIFLWNPIPATGKPAGIIVFLALALFGTFLLERQTAEEFPAPGGPLPPGAAAA
jgi:hypothetical protein